MFLSSNTPFLLPEKRDKTESQRARKNKDRRVRKRKELNTVLGALLVADDGIRNEGAWATLDQSLGFMFS